MCGTYKLCKYEVKHTIVMFAANLSDFMKVWKDINGVSIEMKPQRRGIITYKAPEHPIMRGVNVTHKTVEGSITITRPFGDSGSEAVFW